MARAMSSLPVPVSPWTSTAQSVGATVPTSSSTARNFGLDPINSETDMVPLLARPECSSLGNVASRCAIVADDGEWRRSTVGGILPPVLQWLGDRSMEALALVEVSRGHCGGSSFREQPSIESVVNSVASYRDPFARAGDRFASAVDSYAPRIFVRRELTLGKSGRATLSIWNVDPP